MKLVGAIGLLASGKDAVINYVSLAYGLPMVSSGDITREIAMLEGKPLTRECLTQIAAANMSLDPEWYPKEVLRRIRENGWSSAAITGIRTHADIRTYKSAVGSDFVCFHVQVSDPEVRLNRVKLRRSSRDPQTIQELMEQDKLEMKVFEFDKSIPLADVTIDNDGTIEETQAQVDYYVSKYNIADRPKSPSKYWFLIGCNYNRSILDGVAAFDIESSMQRESAPLNSASPFLQEIFGKNVLVPTEIQFRHRSTDSTPIRPQASPDSKASYIEDRRKPLANMENTLFKVIPQAIPRAEYFCMLAADPFVCLSSAFKSVVSLGRDNLAMVVAGTSLGAQAGVHKGTLSRGWNKNDSMVWNLLPLIANPSYIVIHDSQTERSLEIESPANVSSRLDSLAPPEVQWVSRAPLPEKLAEIRGEGVQKACLFINVKSTKGNFSESADESVATTIARTLDNVRQRFDIIAVTMYSDALDSVLDSRENYGKFATLIERVLHSLICP